MSRSLSSYTYPNQYLPIIILIGLAIGLANYTLGLGDNLGNLLLQQSITSLVIGYGLLWLVYNQDKLFPGKQGRSRYPYLGICFVVLSLLASELEQVNKWLLFNAQSYTPFSGEGLYLFNAIITLILGFSFNNFLENKSAKPQVDKSETPSSPSFVPVKKGSDTLLVSVNRVVLFEASDNFSYLIDEKGQKLICDYSLLQLEERLPSQFMRVHRKYIINSQRISKISPYLKGRYQIIFDTTEVSGIISSSSYKSAIKTLIKL